MDATAPWTQFGLAGLLLGVLVWLGRATFEFATAQIISQVNSREKDLDRARAAEDKQRAEFFAALSEQQQASRAALVELESRMMVAIDGIVERLDQIAHRLEGKP